MIAAAVAVPTGDRTVFVLFCRPPNCCFCLPELWLVFGLLSWRSATNFRLEPAKVACLLVVGQPTNTLEWRRKNQGLNARRPISIKLSRRRRRHRRRADFGPTQ